MSDVMKNAEGYLDTTAGKAINRTEAVHKGQIFEIVKSSGSTARIMVLTRTGKPTGTIMAVTVSPTDNGNGIEIRYMGKTMEEGYASFENVWNSKVSDLCTYVGEIDKESMKDIDSAILYYFGVKVPEPTREEPTREEPIKQDDLDHLIELATLRKEADIYKGLYEKLLGGLM